MDNSLREFIKKETPQLNPDLAGGLACVHLEHSTAYIDATFRAVARDFPPGLEYVGWEYCTAQEEFDEVTRRKNSRRVYDVAISYVRLMKYIFRWKGEEIRRYLYLPYVGDGGVIYISGSRFVISPVLADPIISIGVNDIFMYLGRAKVTVKRMSQYYSVFENGVAKLETVQVSWSLIYNKDPKSVARDVTAETTLVHYLLCKFGFSEMFKRYVGVVPVIGTVSTINEENYPSSEWVICGSNRVKPKSYKPKQWVAPDVRLAIRKEDYTATMKSYVCGFFYIADHFPDRIMIDYVDSKRMWRILMGVILFGSMINEGKLADDIDEHIGSLDEYIDEERRNRFRNAGVHVDDIYQLFGILIDRFNEWLLESSDKINSMYGKELSILTYVLSDIIQQIHKFYFKLKASSRAELTKKDIENYMNQTIKPGLIYSLNKRHGEVSSISYSGDNKALKITALLIPQESSSKTIGRKDNGAMSDPTKWLHPSVAEIGQYSNLPKSEPSGRSRLNQCALTKPDGTVIRNPKFIELLDQTGDQIRRQ